MSNSAISFNTSGLATPTSPGLVGTGAQTFAGKKTLDGGAAIKGDTSGVGIASGYVGENYSFQQATNVSISTSGYVDIATITNLPAGIWLLTGMAEMNNAGSCTGFNLAISEFTGNTTTDQVRGVNQLPMQCPANNSCSSSINNYLVIRSDNSKSYRLKAQSIGAATTVNCSLRAIRIA